MQLADEISLILFVTALIAMLSLRLFRKKRVRVYAPDYQRALLFVDGAFRKVLGPGNYESSSSHEQVTVVDMRPQPIVVERIIYQDVLQTPSVISIAAELCVADPYQAATKLKNFVNDSLAIIRDGLRSIVSKRIADSALETRGKTASDLAVTLNHELGKFGVRLDNLEITEMWSRVLNSQSTTGAN
jgi:regulator of protease activity HflC (stomatin/prohibitin superfamily)